MFVAGSLGDDSPLVLGTPAASYLWDPPGGSQSYTHFSPSQVVDYWVGFFYL